ncbi:MAG: hypothetical protein R3D26_14945 [Cyanobacteriota/Melainabacteria group bacterium]
MSNQWAMWWSLSRSSSNMVPMFLGLWDASVNYADDIPMSKNIPSGDSPISKAAQYRPLSARQSL